MKDGSSYQFNDFYNLYCIISPGSDEGQGAFQAKYCLYEAELFFLDKLVLL